jgi:hypothetical protein
MTNHNHSDGGMKHKSHLVPTFVTITISREEREVASNGKFADSDNMQTQATHDPAPGRGVSADGQHCDHCRLPITRVGLDRWEHR